MARTSRLAPGDRAPAFTLADQEGSTVRLSQFRGRRVAVYFFPKADTPGCTTQSCALRDALGEFGDLGVDVVGISPDPPERQARFDAKYGLGFPLLSDADHSVAEAWGVWGERRLYGRTFMGIVRSAFLVDERGRIAAAFYKVSPKDTVPNLRAALTV